MEILSQGRGVNLASDRGMTMRLPRSLVMLVITVVTSVPWAARAQLSTSYYDSSCPDLEPTVSSALSSALQTDGRIGASILRLHFHDCFVNGCDGSVLLADTSTFTGEQSAPINSDLRGFDVVDSIKSQVESVCPGTVSCADLLALIARDAVIDAGGPFWSVEYGRRDSTTACSSCTSAIPEPTDSVSDLTTAFANQGLSQFDMVALAGAHTIGKAHCTSFEDRITGNFNPTISPSYLSTLQGECLSSSGVSTTTVVNLDTTTPFTFDSAYYSNLESDEGLLTSDQNLQSEGGPTATLVGAWAASQTAFFNAFTQSIVNMGNINPLTGSSGEIRTVCSVVN